MQEFVLELMPSARQLRSLAAILFVVAVPFFLIATNVRWVIDTPLLYGYGFDRYDIPARAGIERSELMKAAGQIRDYFSNDAEDLAIRVVVRGIRVRNLYNDREVAHMRDVKGLVRGVYLVHLLAGAYLASFAVVGLAIGRRRFLPLLGRSAGLGGALTVALVLLVGLASLAGFDRLFLAFHLVSFSNDLWQLDPSRDYLIAMFPQGFFSDATMWIALSTIGEALVLALVPLAVWRRPSLSPKRVLQPTRGRRGRADDDEAPLPG